MAQIRGTSGDNPMLIGTAGDTYLGGEGDDTYIIDSQVVQSGATININDDAGNNKIRLTSDLEIANSQVLAEDAQLTLTNGTKIFVQGADAFDFEVGGNIAGNNATSKGYGQFVRENLGATVPDPGENPSSGGQAKIPDNNGEGDQSAGGSNDEQGNGGTITVSSNNTGPFDASDGDVEFDFEPGGYTATIENFDSGDQIVEPDAGITVQPDDQTDGVQEFTFSEAGGTATIRLTGLTGTQDENLFKDDSFNALFGQDTLI